MNKLTGTILTLPKMSGNVGAKTIYIGGKGDDGATFIPSVSADGIISWTNDKDLPNPEPVNIKGTKGDKGDKGDQGIQGDKGDTGATGEPGPKGDQGDPGKDGANGKDGSNGKDGVDGKDGVSATHSWNGTTLTITSASGTSSADLKGDKGDKGDTGSQGVPGEKGETGAKGDKGDKGDQGEQGVQGIQGIQGIQGEQGPRGEKGDPFYIAKVYASVSAMNSGYASDAVPVGGFVVIETGNVNDADNAKLFIKGNSSYEFLTDLSGAQGVQGPQGETGIQGPKGDQGEQGIQGIQGPQGETGAKGDKGDKGDTGSAGTNGKDGKDGTSVTVKSVSESSADGGINVVTFSDGKTLTVKNGSKGSTGGKGDTGATGQRGTGLLPVTTSPASYTNEVGGITPKYRMALSTIKTQAGVTEVLLGDTVRYSYYHYPIAYLDASHAYFTTRVSIRGATGAAGTTPVKGTDYFTEADKAEMVEDVKNSIPGLGDLLGGGVEEVTYVPSLDGYLKVETGAIYTGTAGTYHTDYIALEGYAEILASCNISSQGYALAFFDSSKTLLPAISIVAEGSGVTKTINMEVPSEAAYCMLCDYEYAPPSNAFITLIPSRGIVERVDELDARTNPLNGKTIAVLGDSISSVAYTVPNYWQMIAEKTGCNFLDYGVSGSCFAVRSAEHTKSFLERAADMASADAVLVMGGTNDANKNILLGDWASTDNTTLYGSLNALIALLRSKYPGRPIVFCTPIKMKGDTDDGFPKTMADLKNATASTNLELWHCALAIQAKCAVHGIPVIDLYNASGIGSGLSGFFRPDDSLHPSILGECRIANMVQPVLEQQFLYTTEYVAEPVNLVPTSIDTDGSIFNGTGYKDGYRLSSSGNTSVQAGSTVTGFIEFITSDVLRIKGVTMTDSNAAGTYVNNSYIAFYDSAFTKIGVTNNAGGSGICPNAVNSYRTSETNGVHTYDFSAVDGTNVKYIRISSPFGEAGSGSGMFVTVNQEIT